MSKKKIKNILRVLKQNKDYYELVIESKTDKNMLTTDYYKGRLDEINFTIWLIEEVLSKEEK